MDGELGDRIKNKDIRQAIDPRIANDAERMVRDSIQNLGSESLSPDEKSYAFQMLEPKQIVKSVVEEWFKVGYWDNILYNEQYSSLLELIQY